jgi:hypothetical protein
VQHSKIASPFPSRVNGTHYRAAALLSVSPQLAESIRAAKRFRVVPRADMARGQQLKKNKSGAAISDFRF